MKFLENDHVRIEQWDTHERIYPKTSDGLGLLGLLDHYARLKEVDEEQIDCIKKCFNTIIENDPV